MLSLLKLFSADKHLLESKGSFIIRQLCVLLSSEDIYRSMSELLVMEENLKFARVMVETLSTILLTSSELFDLRSKLKELVSSESCQLFCCLYQTWCHSQVSKSNVIFSENPIYNLISHRLPASPCVSWLGATLTPGTLSDSLGTRSVSSLSLSLSLRKRDSFYHWSDPWPGLIHQL